MSRHNVNSLGGQMNVEKSSSLACESSVGRLRLMGGRSIVGADSLKNRRGADAPTNADDGTMQVLMGALSPRASAWSLLAH